MKKLFLPIFICCLAALSLLCACDMKNAGPLKSITRPYIAQYQCTEAELGDENLLDKFEYIKIVLVNKEDMQIVYKPKDGESKTISSTYELDTKTHRLTAQIGILGYDFKQSVIVENGKFTISMPIGGKQLVMKFKAE